MAYIALLNPLIRPRKTQQHYIQYAYNDPFNSTDQLLPSYLAMH